MKPAAPQAIWGPAAVGHCRTRLKSAGLETAFFFCFEAPPGCDPASPTLPGSWVLNQLHWEQKNINQNHLVVEGLNCFPGVLLSMLERPSQESSATVGVVASAFGAPWFKIEMFFRNAPTFWKLHNRLDS